jgi:oligopeptide/dipeptide ABC transporter ATP-binding protein
MQPSKPNHRRVLLDVQDIRTIFRSKEGDIIAVEGLSFQLHEGETLAVVGESGCGKSVTSKTILNILSKNARVTSGKILFQTDRNNNEVVDILSLPPDSREMLRIQRLDISMIFQEPMSAFSPVITVGNQIRESAELYLAETAAVNGEKRPPKAVRRAQNHELMRQFLDLVHLKDEDIGKYYTYNMSGGMRQRAMIAMALIGSPKILIADEPTTALDVTLQAQILDLLNELKEERGMSIIFVTHDLGVVAEMAQRVLVMYLGKAVEVGTVDQIFYEAKHPYTQALLASTPTLVGDITELEYIEGNVPPAYEMPSGCRFHTRCKMAMEGLCDVVEPVTTIIDEDHEVLCHLYSGGSDNE